MILLRIRDNPGYNYLSVQDRTGVISHDIRYECEKTKLNEFLYYINKIVLQQLIHYFPVSIEFEPTLNIGLVQGINIFEHFTANLNKNILTITEVRD
mgnify:CR=1 FL=1